ncbi:MAG: hypothetical protein PXZ07_07150 [Candidatus Eremiobacteraeota bacterium]|nr:hypothetical protein [Candidatus Eremiobacteraeota bacterium]
MSEREAPDFAMRRAVEVLASIYERKRPAREPTLPPRADAPIALFNERLSLVVGTSTRREVERELGIAYRYPAAGWHTYCIRIAGERAFLSLFFSGTSLSAAELYRPRAAQAPPLEARDCGAYRLVPGEIGLGMQILALPDYFTEIPAPGGGSYAQIFAAGFPGGSALVMGNEGTVERLAVYVDSSTAPATQIE